jgi:hypothetical protein
MLLVFKRLGKGKDVNIVEEIKETLKLQNHHEKESQLEQLSDVFEYCRNLSEGDVAEGVQFLVAEALQEADQDMKESLFHAINNAVVYQHIGSRINWDMLAASLPSLEKMHLDYALNILGLSVQEKYLFVLGVYTHDPDLEIRKWAQEAIEELEDRVTHATASQKVR